MRGEYSENSGAVRMGVQMKNIIFDVGNVLIGYRWREMCLDEGWDEEKTERIGRGFFLNPKWSDVDAGLVSVDEVVEDVARQYPAYREEARWFFENGEKMTVGRPRVWELVKKLKEKGYGIYLLSNYSEKLFRMHTEGLPFWESVDGYVVSYEIHVIKPNPPIYEHLLQKYCLKAEECLFFDDRPENTEAAENLGMEAVTVVDGSEEFLLRELKKLVDNQNR